MATLAATRSTLSVAIPPPAHTAIVPDRQRPGTPSVTIGAKL